MSENAVSQLSGQSDCQEEVGPGGYSEFLGAQYDDTRVHARATHTHIHTHWLTPVDSGGEMLAASPGRAA